MSKVAGDRPLDRGEAAELLYREAHFLDTQRWDDWLALYCRDAVFWMPAWKSASEQTDCPDTELSLIYCTGRAALEERVWRARSGLSVASAVLPRTSHMIANVLLDADVAKGDEPLVHSTWTSHLYDVKRGHVHVMFGRYEHRLRREAERWAIASKKIVLLNDCVPTPVDFYCV